MSIDIKAMEEEYEVFRNATITTKIYQDIFILLDEVERLRKEGKHFGKEIVFHFCGYDEKIRPYPIVLCSICPPKETSTDFNAYKQIRELQKAFLAYQNEANRYIAKWNTELQEKLTLEAEVDRLQKLLKKEK